MGREKKQHNVDSDIMELLEKGVMRKKEVAEHLGIPLHRVYKASKNKYNNFPSRAESVITSYEQQVLRGEIKGDGSPRILKVKRIAELLRQNDLPMSAIADSVDVGHPLVKTIYEFLKQELGYTRERHILRGVRERTNKRGITREWLIHHRFEKGMTLEQMGSLLGVTRERVRQVLKKEGLDGRISLLDRWYEENTFETTPVDVSYFDNIETEQQAYWIGYLVSKSRLRYSDTGQGILSLSFGEEELPHFSRLLLLLDCPIEFEPKPETKKYTHSLDIYSDDLLNVLLKHGGKIFRTGVGFSPSPHIPEHLLAHYIRAVWETKSYFTDLKDENKERICFVYASEEFLEFYAAFMRKHGAVYADKAIRTLDRGRHQIMTTSGEIIYNIYKALYTDASLALPSKAAEAQAFMERHEKSEKKRVLPSATPKKRARKKRTNPSGRKGVETPFNSSYFDAIDTEEKAYWVGYFLNSFSLETNRYDVPVAAIHFVEDKAQHRRRFFSVLESDPAVSTNIPKQNGNKKRYYEVKIASAAFAQQAMKLSLLRGDWNDLAFPDWLDAELIPHFVRGYYEAHGFITTNGRQLKLVLGGGEAFMKSLTEWLRTEGLSISDKAAQKPEAQRKQVRLNMQGKTLCQQFAMALYGNATLYNEEKANQFNQFFGGGES